MLYDIEEPIKEFNKFLNEYGASLKYEEDKFIVEVTDENNDCIWEINEFISEELCIMLEHKSSKDEKTETGYEYTIDTLTMEKLDKIWEKLGEEFYRKQIDEGFMNKTIYHPEDNSLELNIHNYNKETIAKIEDALEAKRWYIVFDGWAEDMYIVYEL